MRTLVLAAAAVAILAAPAFAATTKTAAPAGTSKMAGCAKNWRAMSAADKAKFGDQAKSMKSKAGGKMSGYNAFTPQCMKK